jgi:hypothetical protein
MSMSQDEILGFKTACLQAAATLLAGHPAHPPGRNMTGWYTLGELEPGTAEGTGPERCVHLAKQLFKAATSEEWPD